jgi:hypothetical protein
MIFSDPDIEERSAGISKLFPVIGKEFSNHASS